MQHRRNGTAPTKAAGGALLALLLPACAVVTPARPARAADPTAPAPARLVNLDTPSPLATVGATRLSAETRLFGGEEDNAYTTLAVHRGFRGLDGAAGAPGNELILRGTFGRERTLRRPGFTLRHGGSDVELLAKFRPAGDENLAFAVGLTLPDTPAQGPNRLHGSAQVLYRLPASRALSLYLAPKAQFIQSNTLVGIGFGAAVRVSSALTLVADGTAIVAGDNTYDPDTGERRRESTLWGAALRYAPTTADPLGPRFSAEVGVTSALGPTTGFSLTPGLDRSVALQLGLGYRL